MACSASDGGDGQGGAGTQAASGGAGAGGSSAGGMGGMGAAGRGGATSIDMAGSGSNAGRGGGGGGSAGASSTGPCPASPPREGSACTMPELGSAFSDPPHCTWGDSPRMTCRTQASCQAGVWLVTAPTGCDPPAQAPGCPAAPPTNGADCSGGVGCEYEDGSQCTCALAPCNPPYPACDPDGTPPGNDPPTWTCYGGAESGCEGGLPNAGTACDPSARPPGCGGCGMTTAFCSAGVWRWRIGPCPGG